MIVTTDAVVLRGIDYRDSSKILTMYTRGFGKLSVIAKGARRAHNRFGNALEPMSYVSAVLYKKESRELHLLSQCDVLRTLRGLTEDLEKMAAGMSMIELLNAVTHDEEENEPLFSLLTGCLEAANDATKGAANTLYLFEVRLLNFLGFRPEFGRCTQCGAALGGEFSGRLSVDLARGGIMCVQCASEGRGGDSISAGSVTAMRRMQELEVVGSVTRILLSPQMRNEIKTTLRGYLRSHVEGLRNLKSESVFASIL